MANTINEAIARRLALLAGGQVYQDLAPQEVAYPYIVYMVVTSDMEYSDDGCEELGQYRVMVNTWDETNAGAKSLMREVKAIMRVIGSDAGDGLDPVAEQDNANALTPPTEGFGRSCDFTLWYNTASD